VDLYNVLGPDTPRESLTPDGALANAPARDGDYFKVPKVLGDSQ
jgi:Asp-tRNA(Asn)/Glu-tRNA(Gln) amidotransferase C subunit